MSPTSPESTPSRILHDLGEHFAAGFMEEPGASPMIRWSRAVRRRLEHRSLPTFGNDLLYPAGPARVGEEDRLLSPSYSCTWTWNRAALEERLNSATPEQRDALVALRAELVDLDAQLELITTIHTVGGRGYTHSVPNYGRVLREGLDAHAERVAQGLQEARESGDPGRIDLYLGLQDVLAGARAWHARLLQYLKDQAVADPFLQTLKSRLVAALECVPLQPAQTFFEAVVAYNFVYYLDDCDNPGRVDQELFPYFKRDLAAHRTSHDDAVLLIRCLWANCDANDGWSAGIGGTDPEGEAAHNELTVACLEAARGMRRPNLQLHLRQDTPDHIWNAALDTIATGCGLPALHNEEQFLHALREADLGIREEDIGLHNGGGCTETMIHGLSNVGSLDAGLNLPLILTGTLDNHLPAAVSFDDLTSAYQRDVADAIAEIATQVSASQEARSRLRPQPMRSLLIDDCIDVGVEYNAGGARYNWSVINVAGLATVADSLAAVREVVFEARERTGTELLEILHRDYEDEEFFRRRLTQCPRFGNDDAHVDGLASDLAEFVFGQLLGHTPWRGGKFLPSCLMFVTYAAAGAPVGATPDGRRAGEPIADSAGPHQGRDLSGPTAMLKSVAAIPHWMAPGTLVVNARFTPDFFTTLDRRRKLADVVRTYFDLGGMQLQINVVDQSVLQSAILHPERHQDLVVRVGGYSEYFHRLSPELQQTVLERTEHGL